MVVQVYGDVRVDSGEFGEMPLQVGLGLEAALGLDRSSKAIARFRLMRIDTLKQHTQLARSTLESSAYL